MNTNLIPAPDPAALPGPPWLFHVLLVVTFFVHLLFMNFTLGGTILAAIAQLTSREPGDHRAAVARRLMHANTYAISLTITTGVAPLLFIQVLFQQYFYSATILIAWGWLSLIVLLMLGYYSAYLYKFRGAPAHGEGGTIWLVLSALMFLAIAMLHVAVNLIHSQPGTWETIADRPWSIFADRAYFVRLFHFILAGVGFSALLIAWWAARAAEQGRDAAVNERVALYGLRWALWTTIAQVTDGFLLLMVLPTDVLLGLMRGGAATVAPLAVSMLLAFGLVAMLARVTDPVGQRGLLVGAGACMILTIGVMSITRHQVRLAYLAPATSRFELQSAPQWGNFALFLLVLAAGLGVLHQMLRSVRASMDTGAPAGEGR